MERTILHIDINNCYASIECLHHPELRGKPVAVGGDESVRHGIILAKNEVAKKYGVKTGETLWQARGKCPDLVLLPPRFELYLSFSRMAREIYSNYTDLVEPFGLDEVWADVTGCVNVSSGKLLAEDIRRRIKTEMGVTVSIGVSFNKVFAKLGSDYKKPDAVTEFSRENFREKVWPLPVEALLYVGPATTAKLDSYGIRSIGELANTEEYMLRKLFGKRGTMLRSFAIGEDLSPVSRVGTETEIKSIGNSTTTPRDICNENDAGIVFGILSESVAERLRSSGFLAKTVQIEAKTDQLFTFERQKRLNTCTCLSTDLRAAAVALLRENYDWRRPLRSIGIRATNLMPASIPRQLSIFEDEERRRRCERLETAMDDIRRRFGKNAINRAISMYDNTLVDKSAAESYTYTFVGVNKI